MSLVMHHVKFLMALLRKVSRECDVDLSLYNVNQDFLPQKLSFMSTWPEY